MGCKLSLKSSKEKAIVRLSQIFTFEEVFVFILMHSTLVIFCFKHKSNLAKFGLLILVDLVDSLVTSLVILLVLGG